MKTWFPLSKLFTVLTRVIVVLLLREKARGCLLERDFI